MRKIATTFFLFVFSFCFSMINVKISGKITNIKNTQIIISGYNFKTEIPVNNDGVFKKEFGIERPGIYVFSIGENSLLIFLEENSDLKIETDYKNFDEALKIEGNGSDVNRYYIEKSNLYFTLRKYPEDIYSKNEKDFLKAVDTLTAKNTKLLENTKNLSPLFVKLEKNDIFYGEQYLLTNYENNYFYYTENKPPKAKLVDSRIVKNLNYNTDDFIHSSNYRNLLPHKFNVPFEKGTTNGIQFLESEFSKINSPEIKNYILNNLFRRIEPDKKSTLLLYNSILSLSSDEKFKKEVFERIENLNNFNVGSPAPDFELEDQFGEKVSLESLKGKYIYLDIWATWCGPCLAEIPHLKKIEEKFRNRNISFVSISTDNSSEFEKWKKMLYKKKMTGIQLFAGDTFKTKIISEYSAIAIPKFVLIDPNGILINIDAPRPSNPKLIKTLNNLSGL
ncbi:MAG: TlpA family protein disulfide reductase [Flavobacterium sp.]